MDWLENLKKKMWESTNQEALKNWPPFQGCSEPYFDLRYEHVKHVEKAALMLQKCHGGDMDIVLASVWSHDITKFLDGDHAQTGSIWVLENLAGLGFPTEKVDAVTYAVSVHSGWVISDIKSTEGKILWDADKLAHFGPAWFMDTVFAYTSKEVCKRENNSEFISFHETVSMDHYMDRIQSFKKRLDDDRINTMFYFEESKKCAIECMETMAQFCNLLEKQIK